MIRAYTRDVPHTPLRCWLGLHDAEVKCGDRELYLRCVTCQRRTAGWQLGDRPPIRTHAGDPARHAIVRPVVTAYRPDPSFVWLADMLAEDAEQPRIH